jgi:hypothetical protein
LALRKLFPEHQAALSLRLGGRHLDVKRMHARPADNLQRALSGGMNWPQGSEADADEKQQRCHKTRRERSRGDNRGDYSG